MRRFSNFTFVVMLVLIPCLSAHAQRSFGAHTLVLDDAAGHTVTIQLPGTMLGNYTWTLPITLGGTGSSVVPAGATNNSTLRWDAATTTWLENTNILSTSAGALSAASLSLTGGTISTPSSGGGAAPSLSLIAGNSGGASSGAFASVVGGNGTGTGQGGQVTIQAGSSAATTGGGVLVQGGDAGGAGAFGGLVTLFGGNGAGTFPGGGIQIQGGYGQFTTSGGGGSVSIVGGIAGSATGTGGVIDFFTTPSNGAIQLRMQVDQNGVVGIGSSQQFSVDNLGNTTAPSLSLTGGTISTPSSGGAATNLSMTAGNSGGASSGASASVVGGNGTGTGQGGQVTIQAGSSAATSGGGVLVQGGDAGGAASFGGGVTLFGGNGAGTFPGGSIQIQGGYGQFTTNGGGGSVSLVGGIAGSATGTGGVIDFFTTPSNGSIHLRMQVDQNGIVGIGPSQELQVDQSGNLSTSGSVVIGSGSTIYSVISAAASLSFPTTAAQSSSDLTITLTGAANGQPIMLGVPLGAVLSNSSYSAWVSAANTVTVRFNNYSTASQTPPASQTFRVAMMEF
ncbi:MAG: hypothetical protein Q8922_15425 [Bacteroidota bacterium]|nr:hypothetical protein [Bacteroidota bacterium]MDP4234783.1 hypothetical protein [Bacteroidota bacterium]MDP4244137.1 hypothetical protein [Bacteroidota bacterium]MDP4289307.1 hypothetical protein [Bacteroidota bacterium]